MDKQEFFEKYGLNESDLSEADVSFEELVLIAEDYQKNEQALRECVKSFIDEYLYDTEKAGIHSYRYRIKKPIIFWKKLSENARKIMKNLKSWITPTIISS